MGNRDILAIGTSAGGVEALLFLAKELPRAFPASILVTIHLPPHFRSSLDEILTNAGSLPAVFASDGEPLRKNQVYLAPPNHHLIVDGERLWLGTGPRENNARPAIDPMLRSAAVCCGSRAVGVVLTGTLGDGASGLWAINQCGGMTVVQDPSDAAFPEMPLTALNRANPDHLARLRDMPALLESLAHQPAGNPVPAPEKIRFEVEIARDGHSTMTDMDRIGRRSVVTCPDCNGVMWEIDEDDFARYRCHIGHTYTAEAMSLALDEGLGRALASAHRALEERIAVARKLHSQATEKGNRHLAEMWAARAQECEREMAVIAESLGRMERIAARAAAE